MRVYKPQFLGTALGTRRWLPIGWQQLRESRVESGTKLKAGRIACLDGKHRKSHIDRLKAQIDAGAYHVDSCALAHKILQTEQGRVFKVDHERDEGSEHLPQHGYIPPLLSTLHDQRIFFWSKK